MARVVVNVMPKAEILDPQGKAVVRALDLIGVEGVSDVRQGKRFELEVDESVTAADLEKIAEVLLANTVIEDYEVVGAEDVEILLPVVPLVLLRPVSLARPGQADHHQNLAVLSTCWRPTTSGQTVRSVQLANGSESCRDDGT